MSDFSSHPASVSPASFDEAQALEALGGDRELLAIVARAFVDEAPRLVERLRAAVASGNAHEVQAAGHALKGTVRFFGPTRLYDLAYLLETLGRSGNLDRAWEALEELVRCVPPLSAAVAACCQRAGHASDPPSS